VLNGWKLLFVCISMFPCSQEMSSFLLSHFATQAHSNLPGQLGYDSVVDLVTHCFFAYQNQLASTRNGRLPRNYNLEQLTDITRGTKPATELGELKVAADTAGDEDSDRKAAIREEKEKKKRAMEAARREANVAEADARDSRVRRQQKMAETIAGTGATTTTTLTNAPQLSPIPPPPPDSLPPDDDIPTPPPPPPPRAPLTPTSTPKIAVDTASTKSAPTVYDLCQLSNRPALAAATAGLFHRGMSLRPVPTVAGASILSPSHRLGSALARVSVLDAAASAPAHVDSDDD